MDKKVLCHDVQIRKSMGQRNENMKNIRVLVLKDNYNSFEQYYLNKLNECGIDAEFYYTSSCKLRKLFTHYALPFESLWYGTWKARLDKFDCIIVFDSLHSANLLRYIHKKYEKRLIFWHWNPIKKDKDKVIWKKTKEICEHWTFNPEDAKRYGMDLNNQFFFYQDYKSIKKEESVFFVGADKGRYKKLMAISGILNDIGIVADFHIIDKDCNDNRKYVEKKYLEYSQVVSHIRKSKAVVEIVQDGQTGLTARALEAMFFGTKLITNNAEISKFDFYSANNIFIIGEDDNDGINAFLHTPFQSIEKKTLYPYDANGWINNFTRRK